MNAAISWNDLGAEEAGALAQEVLARAMACDPDSGAVLGPEELPGELLYQQSDFAMTRDSFWFETPGGIRFSYLLGEAVRTEYGPADSEDEFQLFLRGTVLGAAAWINQLIPLHASAAVLSLGEAGPGSLPFAAAFTGPSGAGKSTLAAGLAATGSAQLCDDTLLLVPSRDGMVALPDGKPLKLWEDSLSALDLSATREIAAVPGKHFADPPLRQDQPCLLHDLVFLANDPVTSIEPILGRDKLSALPDAFYREIVHVKRGDSLLHGKIMAQLASNVRFWRLGRPRKPDAIQAELSETLAMLRQTLAPA